MKYLVTGPNGYIGEHLVRALLQKGHTVNAFLLRGTDPSQLQADGVAIFEGDILNAQDIENALEGCQAVFHLASVVSPWEKDPQIFHRINVGGTQTLLRACKEKGIRRVLVSSSCGIFGPSSGSNLVDERSDHFSRLREPYELSKYHQMEVAKNFLDEGLEILMVYPTRVYGPGLKSHGNSLTAIIGGVLNGTWHIIPGNGNSYGNYVFVDDVAKGMILIMEKGTSGEDYILGGQNASYNDLFDIVQRVSHRRVSLYRVPAALMRFLGLFEEMRSRLTGKRPFITVHAAEKFTTDWLVSIKKIRDSLGYRPMSLEEGMRRTVEALLKEPDSPSVPKLAPWKKTSTSSPPKNWASSSLF